MVHKAIPYQTVCYDVHFQSQSHVEGISGALEQVGIGLDVSNLLLARFLQLLQLGVQEHLVVGGLALHLTGAEGLSGTGESPGEGGKQ